MINCIILEDEKAAQEALTTFIAKTRFTECIGVFESGLDIPDTVLKKADLLFLDIQLPELNGLTYLNTITNPPHIVVTTAFSEYALDAFDSAVTDYLLKPFSYERFLKSVNRINGLMRSSVVNSKQHILVYADKATYRLNAQDLLYIKAEVDYVKFVTKDNDILILDSLSNWTEKLKTLNFVRIHRSYTVNLEQIKKVQGNLVYINETSLPIGGKYKEEFLKRFGSYDI